MLKLLLDEQISPQVAAGLRQRNRDIVVRSLTEWESGRFLGLPDEALLSEAAAQHFSLVTYDRRTIPPLLKSWAEEGRAHGGVIFVDDKTVSPADFGALIRALEKVWEETRRWNWTNRIILLRR
ncbi:MAG TPA: DUF5615 family PIN-like protein [Verrucomicrobiae bacterium]|nr:DUF5615 family PIN-like protein [Verrucomicrobiae bacterium]